LLIVFLKYNNKIILLKKVALAHLLGILWIPRPGKEENINVGLAN